MSTDAERLNRQVLDAIADLLKAKGWNVAVIGGTRVERRMGGREFNFKFVVDFTATPPKEPKEPSHDDTP